jgi:hypothetical protein
MPRELAALAGGETFDKRLRGRYLTGHSTSWSMPHIVCPGCGARLASEVSQCDLCGTQLGAPDLDPLGAEPPAENASVIATPSMVATTATARDEEGRYCVDCGTSNPAFARFCWHCGVALVTAPEGPGPIAAPTPAPPQDRPAVHPVVATSGEYQAPADEAGKRALAMVGAAIVLVVVLFGATQLLGNQPASPSSPGASVVAAGAEVPAATVPPEVLDRVTELEARVERAADPEERRVRQYELIEFLVLAGAFARAGEAQEALARETDDAESWADAGSFYLAHMLRSDGAERGEFARRSAYAYELSLQRKPDDVDVMTDLATAYLNDPADPMRAVPMIQQVLEAQPDHARARFNFALMLAQIGRNDQARQELERVLATPVADELVHERAREELARL